MLGRNGCRRPARRRSFPPASNAASSPRDASLPSVSRRPPSWFHQLASLCPSRPARQCPSTSSEPVCADDAAGQRFHVRESQHPHRITCTLRGKRAAVSYLLDRFSWIHSEALIARFADGEIGGLWFGGGSADGRYPTWAAWWGGFASCYPDEPTLFQLFRKCGPRHVAVHVKGQGALPPKPLPAFHR